MNVLALCSGIGGLELGLRMATGGRARAACHVERDAYAACVLMARMEDENLERAPIWDDLTTFDARPWRGVVDCVTAGFPCQPWSVAGKRKGTADARWIWPDIWRIVSECEPGLVFVENVPGLYRHGLRAVLSDLASLGFDAEWTSVRASDVGAPHRRERVFVLAYSRHGSDRGEGCYEPSGRGIAPGSRPGVEHADLARLEGRSLCGCGRANELPPWPPGPSDVDGWREYLRAGGPEPAIRRGADGLPDRMDRLRCLGNAVVPQQAALAFRLLLERISS